MKSLVLLASYPKSGSTWLRAALESIKNGGKQIDINRNPAGTIAAADRELFDQLMGVPASDLTMAEIVWARPQVWPLLVGGGATQHWIKSHDAYLPPFSGAELPFPAPEV